MLTPVRSCTSPWLCLALSSTVPAAARAKNACSSIYPSYLDAITPPSLCGRAAAPLAGSPAPAAGSASATVAACGSASGPVNRGYTGA